MADQFIWYELMTSDEEAALDFYGAVIGWTAAPHENSNAGMRYMILSANGHELGGLMQLTPEMCDGGARPGWIGYIGVDDTDAAAGRIEAAGGAVHIPPTDIPNVGRFAMVADPGGAPFYVMTPLPPAEARPELPPMTPGHFGWHELYTGMGQEAAFDFYSAQFGWTTAELMDMGDMGKYRLFAAGGAPVGGMMDKPKDMPMSAWGFYVHIDGIDAAAERVKAHGGQVLMGPHQVPGDSWIIQCTDPQGAHFALVSQTR